MTMTSTTPRGLVFLDRDVLNPEDYIPTGKFNPWNIRPFLLTNGIYTFVIFAEYPRSAFNIAADLHRIDNCRLLDEQAEEYESDGRRVSYLGKACYPYDIDDYVVEELANPTFSICAIYNASAA